jgi:ankyrin repeat protein
VLEALEAAVQRQYEHDNKDLAEVLKPTVMRLGTTPADVVTRLLNKSNVKGCTPLMLACSGSHTEAVSWLIKHGAQHSRPCCWSGFVWRQRAWQLGPQLNIIILMLVQVLMCGSTTGSGVTLRSTVQQRSARPTRSGCCWHVLARSSTLATTARECVLALGSGSTYHQATADMSCRLTALFQLRPHPHNSARHVVLHRLLEQGNHAGLTALHYAVYCEQHEVVAQLCAQDADITAQAEFPDLDWGCINAGDTPMHIAAHRGNIDAIQVMLKAYVSVRLRWTRSCDIPRAAVLDQAASQPGCRGVLSYPAATCKDCADCADCPMLPLLCCVQNEKSGAFLPSLDGSRRLRDPRAMRNDYGRLPYHLAMRKGLTWLGEMLDPSVPVRCAALPACVCEHALGTGDVLCCQGLGQQQRCAAVF